MRGSDPYVEDLGSTNGTLLNGESVVEPTRLRPGDRVQFGQTVMELVK
jgi:pSer/pThr/pTyr-binding forkhead associated (FHA) protein